jgi:hypothetical protein
VNKNDNNITITINDHHHILINITNITNASPTITYYEVIQRDKQSLIFESILVIRIDVHSVRKNLTQMTYAHPSISLGVVVMVYPSVH